MPRRIQAGVFTVPDRHLPGMWQVGETVGGGNIGHTFGADNTDERSVTKSLAHGRKLVLEYECYHKEYLRGIREDEARCDRLAARRVPAQ